MSRFFDDNPFSTFDVCGQYIGNCHLTIIIQFSQDDQRRNIDLIQSFYRWWIEWLLDEKSSFSNNVLLKLQ